MVPCTSRAVTTIFVPASRGTEPLVEATVMTIAVSLRAFAFSKKEIQSPMSSQPLLTHRLDSPHDRFTGRGRIERWIEPIIRHACDCVANRKEY